jgi:hypothetical protein
MAIAKDSHLGAMERTIQCMSTMQDEHSDLAYYVHRPTGRVWAVEVSCTGDILSAAGPLPRSEATPGMIEHLVLDVRDVTWIKRNRQHFVRVRATEAA